MNLFCARRILYDKRFSVFHYPVLDEDVPDYRSIVHNPMDMATLLQHVDCGQYLTCAAFLQDIDLIVANAKVKYSTFVFCQVFCLDLKLYKYLSDLLTLMWGIYLQFYMLLIIPFVDFFGT